MSVKTWFALLLILLFGTVTAHAREYAPIERKIPPPKFMMRQNKATTPAPRTRARPARQAAVIPVEETIPEPEAGIAPAAPVSSDSRPNLFGTVEFGRPLESLPGWLDVLARNRRDPVFDLKKRLIKNVTWGALKQQTDSLDTLEKLKKVNVYWNQNPYREDMANWGKQDYWAIPAEFIIKSGDCEDYAIAKYFTLKELGIDPDSMRIVVLRDTIRNLAHAVLAVYVNGDIYILDNVTNIVLSHKRIRNYQPQFSVNESGRWTHIKGKPVK